MTFEWPHDDWRLMTVDCIPPQALAQFGSLQELTRSIRNARAEYRTEPL